MQKAFSTKKKSFSDEIGNNILKNLQKSYEHKINVLLFHIHHNSKNYLYMYI